MLKTGIQYILILRLDSLKLTGTKMVPNAHPTKIVTPSVNVGKRDHQQLGRCLKSGGLEN
ncbi:hypothetical protein [Desulfosporosinus metallidurans]|uniref:Uncharacterized protein n=1 Tax=Desulfosporosinus metallidurans TaxID=1888891 RepID=A0A1Q8QM71_9FIRM|nr:hypothetical protein [Desulfosporosinus metallidurans]OLN28436.1 hypothetical protein DSOL_4085 [Desulfosporosinus metallidurans]